ncbi:MAG: molecular chaperone DnaJ [Rhodobacterales bacterium]|nr:molecular chaperone DnaJ [Rhodobacterales bacterium]
MPRDYYEVLGVQKDADAPTIKKAFKKAARKFHPDLNPDNPEAEVSFKEASEAYDVLSKPEKRKVYDQYGHEGLHGRGFDPNFTDINDIFSAFGDMFGGGFSDFFGGGGGRSRSRGRRSPKRGADLEMVVPLSFMEAALGVTKQLEIPRHTHCETCDGGGLKDGAKAVSCGTCAGHGQVIQAQGFLRIRTTCPACQGQGKTVDPGDQCEDCGGGGRKRETIEIEARIPPGTYGGLQIRHPGKGEVGEPGAPHGDLYLTLDVQSHEVFKRDGADVYVTVPVPYAIMALGGEICIPTVHGEEPMTVKQGTASGDVIKLRGKGTDELRARGTRGDHHVRLVVDVPTELSEEEEDLLRKLAEIQSVGVTEKGFWKGLFEKFTI